MKNPNVLSIPASSCIFAHGFIIYHCIFLDEVIQNSPYS